MVQLNLSFLGSFAATQGGSPITRFRSVKEQALLAYLAEEADHAHQRSTLLGLLWPELPERSARNNLSQTLSRLRRTLESPIFQPEYLVATRQIIRFAIRDSLQIDTAQFRALLDIAQGETNTTDEEYNLEAAAQLCRGEFLQGLSVPACEEFEMWLLFKREYYKRLLREGLERLTTLYLDGGRYADAQVVAQRHLALEPWAEVAHRQLIMALALNDQRTSALAQYEQCRERLWNELGVAPDAATTALMQRIKSGEFAPTNFQPAVVQATNEHLDAAPSHASSTQIATATLKIQQIKGRAITGDQAELSIRSGSEGDGSISKQKMIFYRPPARTISLIGRSRELAEIVNYLSDPQCRLLTLTGPGGVGKTRLAVEVANLVNNGQERRREEANVNLFAHGVAFVPLAAVDEPTALVDAIQTVLGISTPAQQDAQEVLLDYLEGLQLLLLLDNYEQLADDPTLLVALLEQAPAVKLLLTSRVRLNLAEEWVYEVSGLSLPDTDTKVDPDVIPPVEQAAPGDTKEEIAIPPPPRDWAISSEQIEINRHVSQRLQPTVAEIAQSSAVQLFVRHAKQVHSNFELNAENATDILRICTLTTGLPLALELAASWVRALSCAEIYAEIQQNIDFLVASSLKANRHRTLEAVFESSWRYLDEKERTVLLQISIFRGGFDRKAAYQVARAPLPVLVSLIDHSFIKRSNRDGYEMHELLRQFAARRLAADIQLAEQTRTAHADYYAEFLAERAEWMSGKQVIMALEDIKQHFENIRIAWRRLIKTGAWQRLDSMIDTLYQFATIRGRRSEAVNLLEEVNQILTQSSNEDAEMLMTQVRSRLGACYLGLGEQQLAHSFLEESLERAKAAADLQESAFCLSQLGFVLSTSGDLPGADQLYTESLQIYQDLGDATGTADLLNKRGVIAHDLGTLMEAREFYVRSYTLAKAQHNIYLLSTVLFNLGKVSEGMGEYTAALSYYHESMPHQQTLNDSEGIGYVLHGSARVEMHNGNYQQANELCSQALSIFHSINFRRGVIFALALLGEIALQQGHAQRAAMYLQESLTLAQEFNSPLFISIDLTLLGQVALGSDNRELAMVHGCNALEIAKQIPSKVAEASALCLLGTISTLQNDYSIATEYFENALEIAKESTAPLIQLEAQLGMATLLFYQGKGPDAFKLLQEIHSNPALTYMMRQLAGQLENLLESL